MLGLGYCTKAVQCLCVAARDKVGVSIAWQVRVSARFGRSRLDFDVQTLLLRNELLELQLAQLWHWPCLAQAVPMFRVLALDMQVPDCLWCNLVKLVKLVKLVERRIHRHGYMWQLGRVERIELHVDGALSDAIGEGVLEFIAAEFDAYDAAIRGVIGGPIRSFVNTQLFYHLLPNLTCPTYDEPPMHYHEPLEVHLPDIWIVATCMTCQK